MWERRQGQGAIMDMCKTRVAISSRKKNPNNAPVTVNVLPHKYI